MKTKWHCEKCGEEGEVKHDRKAGVWDIIQKIRDQHYHASLICVWNPDMVRITVEEGQKIYLMCLTECPHGYTREQVTGQMCAEYCDTVIEKHGP